MPSVSPILPCTPSICEGERVCDNEELNSSKQEAQRVFSDQGTLAEEQEDSDSDEYPETDHAAWWLSLLWWFSGTSALGYACSAVVHSLILAGLSIVVVSGSSGSGGVDGGISLGEPGTGTRIGQAQIPLDTNIELDGLNGAESILPVTEQISSLSPDELGGQLAALSSVGPGSFSAFDSGTGKGTARGNGSNGNMAGFAMPGSGRVITKGSFTAWTVPEDPEPNENYLIVIQVELPRKYPRLPLNDISGDVHGTDGYHLHINSYTSTYIQKSKQVVLRIPGAELKVRDRIHVESAILKESQDLDIEF